MKNLNHFLQPVKKFAKGLFVLFTLNLFLVFCMFIFDSCQKANYESSRSGQAKDKFIYALKSNKDVIGAVTFKNAHTTAARGAAPANEQPTEYESVYLDFPTNVSPETNVMYQNTNSIQSLSDLINLSEADLAYEPSETNTSYQIDIPVESVMNSLNPLIMEAKQYLYAKGFTDSEIQNMIITEGGTEQDLIPFVMTLSQIENGQQVAYIYPNIFVSSANAMNTYVKCAMVAIGADALWALGGSAAASWSKAAMARAFGAVAKRFLGPIGVAIAVVSFGVCLAES
ncbi:hypothetical protein U0035_14205 [Niabella yanshanensis]|uniref:Uncharacterized protein n=1 Tax=Niabella yanshanensis TaxID=577386 RepID=A0ABZ0W411_9BACT|nr:hypothetical protein [Niabella yanshanensis]WQD36821.1 hypothetical protein U0035_14205 [Niabella yanshanensis]